MTHDKFILLTGATGYLGSSILKMLVKENYKVILLVREQSSFERIGKEAGSCKIYKIGDTDIETIFREHPIEVVINTAACYGRSNEPISDILFANTVFPLQLLKLSIDNGVKCFINTDSSLPAFTNEYALSKDQFRQWLFYYSGQVRVYNCVLEYFYGPEDSGWKFVTMLFRKFIDKEASVALSSGKQQRRFIYIDDVVNAFSVLLKNRDGSPGMTEYSLGGTLISIRDLVYLCSEIAHNEHTTLNFSAVQDRPTLDEMEEKEIRSMTELGWAASVDLREGLCRTFDSLKLVETN